MEDWQRGFGRRTALGTEDLQEEEVWAMMKAREGSKSKKNSFSASSSSPSSSAWRFIAPPRAIPRSSSSCGGHQEFSSAPVDIPDWSKILRRKSKKNLWDDEYDNGVDDDGERKSRHANGDAGSDDDDGDDDDGHDMVPPHEYLARRLASTQIASFSMCEGVGRTLKGRDLSKLRNAILTKTGFLE